MKKINIIALFGMIAILACSDATGPEDDVILDIYSGHLFIENNTSGRVYYIVMESEFATLVDWAPGFNGPSIESGKTVAVPLSEIDNAREGLVQSGDRILLYWWTDEDKQNPHVQYKSITIK